MSDTRPPLQLGVLISGRGSNLGAILSAIDENRLNARVNVVISNRADALGLALAERAGVPTRVIAHGGYADRQAFDGALVEALRAANVEWVVLAGFMRIVTPVLLDAFPLRVLNVHPSLLPAFPGVDAQKQALDYGARVTGCTVHLVDAGTDTGPILAQTTEPIREGDTRDALAARLIVKEHALLVDVLGWLAAGRVKVVPRAGQRPRVIIDGSGDGA